LPKAGPWMERIKALFGLLLLATAWWMARPILPGGLYILGWAFLALWTAAWLSGARTQDAAPGPLGLAWRAVAGLLVLWAAAQLAGLLAGGRDMLRPLAPFTSTASGSAATAAVDPEAIRARFTRIASVADLDAALAATTRPVMLDFYADWCVSC